VAAHPGADERELADLAVAGHAGGADLRRDRVEDRLGRGQVLLGQRERDVRVPGGGDVLDDHVDVDPRVRERAEDAARDPGAVGHVLDRRLRLAGVARDPGDDRLLEHVLLLHDPRPLLAREGRADVDRHAVVPSVLDGPQHEHLRPGRRELEHLLVADRGQLAGAGDDARVGGEDAVDVGVDLADVGVERGRHRDRGRVRAAAPERRHVRVGGNALESRDDRDLPGRERVADAVPADLDDARAPVGGVGDDARLRAGERNRVAAEVDDRHREQRDRDLLARGEEHVLLARVRPRGDGARERDELVGRVAHRRDDDADLASGLGRLDDAARHALDALGVADGGAAVLLDDESHAGSVVTSFATRAPAR
jgi:hypothetical protein